MKKQTLGMRLSLSYALMALLLVAAVSLLSNFFLRDAFVKYVMREQAARNESVVAEIERQFLGDAESFPAEAMESIGMRALEDGMILKVSDGAGSVVWDATKHNNGLCNQMLTSMAESMQSRYPSFQGAYEEKTYALTVAGTYAGEVKIGYYGPYYLTDSDSLFIETLNLVLAAVGALSLLVAGVLGFFMARGLSRPISQATGAAKRIAAGNYRDKIGVRADTRELYELVQSLNMLSGTLEEQEMLRRRLTQDVAHELRTPLTALQGNLEALIDGVWEPGRERFESCHEEVLRIGRLVQELEKLARLEGRLEHMETERVELKSLAQKALQSFEHAALEKGIALRAQGDPVTIEADRNKLFQVLANLLSNGIKYTPEGGSVAVRTGITEEGKAFLAVEDTGEGIEEKDIPYIFERFYRADASRSSRTGGIGIGLAIVKAIVELHRGTVSVRSERGKGTAFIVTLPMEQEKETGKG